MTNKKNKSKPSKFPFVSICTPTFNRRPFIPIIIKCFEHQTYPKDKMEWIIIDDGPDKIEDLVKHIPQVKYFKYDEKMTLGKKRNLMHSKCSGDIIVYMDDDDYYPPERVSHAVETLKQNPKALCAGSSAMHIYFKHINKMYQFGPYGPNHSTAATFAFRKELLNQTKYDDTAALAEERLFLKEYKIPFAQMNSLKTILVFSHNQNSFDKKQLLDTLPNNPTIHETTITVDDFVKEPDIKKFFMEDIDEILANYKPGDVQFKQDVLKQTEEIKIKRDKQMREMQQQQIDYQNTIRAITNMQTAKQNATTPSNPSKLNNDQNFIEYQEKMNQLAKENLELKEKVKYLEDKIKTIITEQIKKAKEDKMKNQEPVVTLVENKNNNNNNEEQSIIQFESL